MCGHAMPLFNMSINTQDGVELSARKRAHSEFAKSDENVKPQDPKDLLQSKSSLGSSSSSDNKENTDNDISSTPMDLANSPTVKGSPGLTESGSSPPEGNSPSPHPTPTRAPLVQSTLARFTTNVPPATHKPSSSAPKTQAAMAKQPASTSAAEPPAKRKKLSPEEQAAKEAAEDAKKKEREQKKKEKEEADKKKAELKAAKAAELAKAEAEKQRKAEEKKKEKEEAERQKAELKAAKDAEKQRKLEEKQAKQREKEEEEAKKAKSQKKLTSMFKMTPAAPKKDKKAEKDQENGAVDGADGAPKEESAYKATFQPFYVKANVKIADTLFVGPETCAAKTKILEEWMEGKRGELELGPFNPREACQLIRAPIHRGRVYPKVGKIMAEYHNSSSGVPVSEAQIRHTREALKSVPVKSLKFREDVRPPYIGTISGLPAGVKSLNKIARNPIRKDILPLNYDYDSEAEWQEDDGEDVDDLDDEEEDLEDDEGMDDFLDDSEDAGPARLLFSGGMEPESTGLCWESHTHVNPTESVEQYRLELWPEHLENHASINPWVGGDIYWPKKDKDKKGKDREENGSTTINAQAQGAPAPHGTSEATAGATEASPTPNSMAPPPVPSDAFQALTAKNTEKKPAQKLPPDALEELKELLRSKPNLSKVGIVEVFAANHMKKFPKTQIKAAVEDLTEKAGKGWKLKDA